MGDTDHRTDYEPEPAPEGALVVMLRSDQRMRWYNGERIPVEAYFEHYPELLDDPMAMKHLVRSELILRRELREPLDPAEFRRRFPTLDAWLTSQFEQFVMPPTDADSSPASTADTDHAATPWPVLPGYEIVEEIGHGGMGIVYKARQARLNRFVALKVLRAGANAGPRTLARFRAEADAIARLQHPYIVQLLDVIDRDDQMCISLEYVGGGSLSRQIARRQPTFEEAAVTVGKIARAVHFAHERGIIHRDLKPANILLTEDGIPKITDFGLAKRLDDEMGLTQSGTALGTPDYMAPEQAEGRIRDIGPVTDVYALGAILYEMLVGKPPFRGEAMIKVLDAVRFSPPRPPSEVRPDLPRDLEAICLKCLEKQPALRYQDAASLADDLDRFVASEPVLINSSPIVARFRHLRRQWGNYLLAVLIIAILVAIYFLIR